MYILCSCKGLLSAWFHFWVFDFRQCEPAKRACRCWSGIWHGDDSSQTFYLALRKIQTRACIITFVIIFLLAGGIEAK
uniref:Uncharacterized protein n=1 Tax=Ixodes ricinus TaxID=34613 RepID=A0A6B0TUQ3_IXORI